MFSFSFLIHKDNRYECASNYDCADHEYCHDHKCVDACSICVNGTSCKEAFKHNAVCECENGFYGSVSTGCHPQVCYSSRGCYDGKVCIDGACTDPCDGTCGSNAHCKVDGLIAVCSCNQGQLGSPFEKCESFREQLCSCGPNSECEVINGFPPTSKCHCLPGYIKKSSGHCYKEKCESNGDCEENQACRNQTCIDPCEGLCGENTICQTKRHMPACACKSSHFGDAFKICHRLVHH